MKYKRIELLTSLVQKNDKVIDIGTDHAFVPIFLHKKLITDNIYATEAAKHPLENARKNILKFNLEKQITLIESKGFDNLEKMDSFDSIIIAGLGGKKISDILTSPAKDNSRIKNRLILNPTNNEEYLRKTLKKLHYKIIEEHFLIEHKTPVTIIVALKKWTYFTLSSKNQFLGPLLKHQMHENEQLNIFYKDREIYYWDLYTKTKKREHLQKYKWIKKITLEYEKRDIFLKKEFK